MAQITRRTLLATAPVALAPGPAAAFLADPKSRAASLDPRDTEGRQGNASITLFVNQAQDVAAIHYTITNVGSAPDTFTVWYTDLNNGRQSRKLVYPLDSAQSASAEVYGTVTHTFVVNVCQSDGACFAVGPVGLVPSAGNVLTRGVKVSPEQPSAS